MRSTEINPELQPIGISSLNYTFEYSWTNDFQNKTEINRKYSNTCFHVFTVITFETFGAAIRIVACIPLVDSTQDMHMYSSTYILSLLIRLFHTNIIQRDNKHNTYLNATLSHIIAQGTKKRDAKSYSDTPVARLDTEPAVLFSSNAADVCALLS